MIIKTLSGLLLLLLLIFITLAVYFYIYYGLPEMLFSMCSIAICVSLLWLCEIVEFRQLRKDKDACIVAWQTERHDLNETVQVWVKAHDSVLATLKRVEMDNSQLQKNNDSCQESYRKITEENKNLLSSAMICQSEHQKQKDITEALKEQIAMRDKKKSTTKKKKK